MAKSKALFSGYPVGALVLLDGKHRARVRAFFPEGSASYPFAHYKIAFASNDGGRSTAQAGSEGDTAVQAHRIGVTPR